MIELMDNMESIFTILIYLGWVVTIVLLPWSCLIMPVRLLRQNRTGSAFFFPLSLTVAVFIVMFLISLTSQQLLLPDAADRKGQEFGAIGLALFVTAPFFLVTSYIVLVVAFFAKKWKAHKAQKTN